MATIEILDQTFALYRRNGELVVLDPCWKCGGDKIIPHYLHVFDGECFACRATGGTWLTPDAMERRMKGRIARKAAAERKRTAKIIKRDADIIAFQMEHEDLAFLATNVVNEDEPLIPTSAWADEVIRSMGQRLQEWGSLSEKQVALARKLLLEAQERQERRAAEKAMADPAPAGRTVVEGEVIKVTSSYSTYGYTERLVYRMTVKTDAGWLCNGTAPTGIEGVAELEGPFEDRIRGRRIRFTATLEPKETDPTFAFFKRPTKCALVDLEDVDPIDLADEAAGDMTPGY